jgi:hypothetical protein
MRLLACILERRIIMSLLLLGALLAAAPAPAADTAIGRWKTETKNGIVEIQRCGPSICGRLLTSELLRQQPDLKDANNQNRRRRRLVRRPDLQSRRRQDLQGEGDAGRCEHAQGPRLRLRALVQDADLDPHPLIRSIPSQL